MGKLWKTTTSVLMHPENPCGAMAPSAVAGVFRSLLSGSQSSVRQISGNQLGAAKIVAIKLMAVQLVAASEVKPNS